ncbi:oxoglutarate-dependent flavonoid 7-O-demethylase 1-like [Gastrolobium bilobum]|uniref:oxoglutarate-dependent flavonoid 7-O-demethylase 1-like n=1 Tax=Gastrolobium bilobum TaxID=150636 RepID=UPI002AB09D5A|nr:oxoglutarate-dependent flavonoid 7-O-demethylase 1-like [Gastrolobium bilobum]
MASPEAARSESSQTVVSIQELAKKSITSLPQFSYMVRDNDERGAINETLSPEIPTIDFEKLIHGDSTQLEQEKLHSACRDWGFFQLVNHGMSPLVMKKVKDEIEEFFRLPSEELMKYKHRPGEVEGYGAVIRSNKKLDWGDKLYMITNPVHRRRPHLFPEFPSSLRTILESYIIEMQNLAITLVGYLGKAMMIEKREMEEMFEDGQQAIRMTYYPPCPQPELVMGISAHSDACGFTILNQLNGVDALQIKKDGIWIPVHVMPDALLVNIGDVLEMMSNGIYKSVDHRAVVSSDKERLSLGMFFNPKYEAEIGPAVNLISPENPALYKRIGLEKYLSDYFSRNMIDGKSYLENMKITNENPVNATLKHQ